MARFATAALLATVWTTIFAGAFLGLGLITTTTLFTSLGTNILLVPIYFVFLYISWVMVEYLH